MQITLISFNDIPPHETPLHTSSSPIPRIRIWSTKDDFLSIMRTSENVSMFLL